MPLKAVLLTVPLGSVEVPASVSVRVALLSASTAFCKVVDVAVKVPLTVAEDRVLVPFSSVRLPYVPARIVCSVPS